jgi:hypothetical protein
VLLAVLLLLAPPETPSTAILGAGATKALDTEAATATNRKMKRLLLWIKRAMLIDSSMYDNDRYYTSTRE